MSVWNNLAISWKSELLNEELDTSVGQEIVAPEEAVSADAPVEEAAPAEDAAPTDTPADVKEEETK